MKDCWTYQDQSNAINKTNSKRQTANSHSWISHVYPRRMLMMSSTLNRIPVWHSQVWTVMVRSISYVVSVLTYGIEVSCTPRVLYPVSFQYLERRILNQTVPSHSGTVVGLQARICSIRGWWVHPGGCPCLLTDPKGRENHDANTWNNKQNAYFTIHTHMHNYNLSFD